MVVKKTCWYKFLSAHLRPSLYAVNFTEIYKYVHNRERFQTTGHERDAESGLDHRGARNYDGDVGRFLSVDPLAEKYPSISTYAYVANNPIIFIDPDGRRIIIGGQEWKQGAVYEGDENSFEARAFNALNTIADGSKSGNGYLTELVESDFDFRIEQGEKSEFVPDNKPEDIRPGEKTVPEPGGGTVYIGNTEVQTEQGKKDDFGMTVMHELMHGVDANRGTLDVNLHEYNPYQKLPKSEFTASDRENKVRAELGKPLRTRYSQAPLIRWDRKSKSTVSFYSGDFIRSEKRYRQVLKNKR